MYVNHWTLDYGDKGRESIRRFLGRAAKRRSFRTGRSWSLCKNNTCAMSFPAPRMGSWLNGLVGLVSSWMLAVLFYRTAISAGS